MQLITLKDGEENDALGPSIDFDPAFQVVTADTIRLTTKKSRELTLSYLAFRIARSPSDLINHTRRIVLESETGNGERLYGALQDLFIALGKRGPDLRKKLLEGAKASLSQERYDVLKRCLYQAEVTSASLPHSMFSVLSSGIVGTQKLVEALPDNPSDRNVDPLEEAQTCIIYSQIDEARLILEQAIIQDPGRFELHKDLLEIYQATRDRENFKTMQYQLAKLGNPYPQGWEEAEIDLFAKRA